MEIYPSGKYTSSTLKNAFDVVNSSGPCVNQGDLTAVDCATGDTLDQKFKGLSKAPRKSSNSSLPAVSSTLTTSKRIGTSSNWCRAR